jgi:hypothetical protein
MEGRDWYKPIVFVAKETKTGLEALSKLYRHVVRLPASSAFDEMTVLFRRQWLIYASERPTEA